METGATVPQTIEKRIAIWPRNPMSKFMSKGKKESRCLEGTIVHSSQDEEAA